MQIQRRLGAKALGLFTASALVLSLSVAVPAVQAQAQRAGAAAATAPITKGQKIVMATHSFNVFISTDPDRPAPTRTQAVVPGGAAAPSGPQAAAPAAPAAPAVPLLTKLTNERGITGQEFLAVQMIGGSTPMQHWNQGAGDDTKNIAKVALNKGGVDVFTMSPNAVMPEPGIDNFGDYLIKTNPNARLMVQSSWSAYDGHGSTPSVGGTGGGTFTNAQRDNETEANVDKWIADQQSGYMVKLRAQLDGINKKAGKPMATTVPSADAVYHLRKLVIEGKVPGVAKQSEMHRDPIGHPTTPTAHLVAYVWFASMYRQSPVGLKALVKSDDPTSAPRELMLQQIAWNAVVSEPMSGVRGAKVAVGAGTQTAAR